jgi:hypothetical protein
MGEFVVAGCTDTSPVLVMTPGVQYTFVQSDATSWFHPLGFAYYPDGAHLGAPELEYPNPADCALPEFGCDPAVATQAPLYGIDGAYTAFDGNWAANGLELYEPAFQVLDQAAWAAVAYTVKLTIPVGSKTQTLFYFCHIHAGMSGQITVAHPAGTTGLNALVTPFAPTTYYAGRIAAAEVVNSQCGTSGVMDDWATAMCPSMDFLCGDDGGVINNCLASIDCTMHAQMRVSARADDPVATFMDLMIPHHVNAVNMAKIMLKLGSSAPSFDADVEALMRDIINTQNAQIMIMNDWREQYNITAGATCPPMVHSGGTPRGVLAAAALGLPLLLAALV